MTPRFGATAPGLLVSPWYLFAPAAMAEQPVVPAVPAAPGAEAVLQVLGALLLVLVAVLALAWLMRRLGPGSQSAGGLLRVVGALAVGPRERVVVVEVGETWLVLGVTQSSVNTLHSMEKPAAAGSAAPAATSPARFARLFDAALRGRGGEGTRQ